MRKRVTARSYAARIERAIALLHADPDRVWRLDDLAAVACFSPWHFHRIYRAIAGETPDETLRRLRLHRAADDLIRSARDVEQIARRAGYGSAAAFTRAFAASYGRPPAAYRRNRAGARARNEEDAAMYEVTIGHEPARRLIGLPYKGSYQGIGAAFERLGALAHGAGLAASGPMIGVYYDDPSSVPESQLRAFAALEAPPAASAQGELELRELAGGPVASIVHKGPYAELGQAYDWLYREWLPGSGREPADAPPYEIYLNDPQTAPATEWLTRIVMPLRA